MLELDKKYFSKYNLIAGIDEAGRGPLAGPVVASSVIFDKETCIEGVNDSKKVSEKKRDFLYDIIIEKALHIGVGIVYPKEIDKVNILNATKKAMELSVLGLNVTPDLLLVDGNQIEFSKYNQENIVKGDTKSFSIAAASIIAKVTRDRMMKSYSKVLPEYGFENHKGYGTKKHLEAICNYKSSIIHRQSFKPVSSFMPTFSYYIDNNMVDRLLLQVVGDYLIKEKYEIIDVKYPNIRAAIDGNIQEYQILSNIDLKQSNEASTSKDRSGKLIEVNFQSGKFKIVIKDID